MKFLYATAAASALVLALTSPAMASTGTATAGSLTATLTVNDATFTGPDCIQAPIQINFSGSGSMDISASQPGSSSSLSAFSYGDQAGTVNDSIQICPFINGAGRYEIRGVLTGDDGSAPLPAGLDFVVSGAPAKVVGLQSKQTGQILSIKGRVIALSERGDIGVQSEVTLQGRLSKSGGGKGKWVTVGTAFPDEFGKFSFRGNTSQRLKGAEIKAVLAASDWASEATASTRVK